jgi:capsular exopolysaccharide synthesis family protein
LSQLDLLETLEGFSGGALAGGNAGLPAPGTPMDLEKLIPVATPAFLDEKLEIATSGSSFTSEQFRNLKVQMSEALGPGPRVFAVSSPDAGDGKSLISLALAFSFAADPARKSLIVDCDLRKPAVQKYLGVTSEPGLLQCLSNGQAGPLCYLRRIGNLYFLTTGGIAPNPVEILSMDKTSRMLGELKRHFDTIVLDAPPYSPIADARLVTKLADGLVLVVRRGRTAFGTTERTLKALDPKKLLGIVFNDVKPMLFNTYQSSYYYGASYGNDESPALNKPRTRTYLDQ